MDRDQMLKILDDIKESNDAQASVYQLIAFLRSTKIRDYNDWLKRIEQLPMQDWVQSEYDEHYTYWRHQNTFWSILAGIRSQIQLYPIEPFETKYVKIIKTNKVFIVHGHNNEMKLDVAIALRKLGLEPIILHEQPNKSRTIIEKFEYYSNDVSFAVVLLSPDDVMADGKHRARQNVILELGYFVAKLGWENVVALYADDGIKQCEIPSDISGVLYEPYRADGAWKMKLVQELREVGFSVSADDLIA